MGKGNPHRSKLKDSNVVTIEQAFTSDVEAKRQEDKKNRGLSNETLANKNSHFLTPEAWKYLTTPILDSAAGGRYQLILASFVRFDLLFAITESLRAGKLIGQNDNLGLDHVKLLVGIEGNPQVCQMCAKIKSKDLKLTAGQTLPTEILDTMKFQPAWFVSLKNNSTTREYFFDKVKQEGLLAALVMGTNWYSVAGNFFVNGEKHAAVCGAPWYWDRVMNRYNASDKRCIGQCATFASRNGYKLWPSSLQQSTQTYVQMLGKLAAEEAARINRLHQETEQKDAVTRLQAAADLFDDIGFEQQKAEAA